MSGETISTAASVGSTLLSAVSVGKSLLTPAPKMDKIAAPAITPAVTMPTMDDDAVNKARNRAVEQRMASSGRQSTILGSNETLG